MQVKLTAYGSSSHGSKPWIGCNAIEKLMKQYYKLISELDLATSKKKWKVSINPTNFMATSPYNVTPSKAEMIVDFRTTEDITNKKILSLLKKQKIKYKVIINRGMLFTSVKNPYVRELKKIMQRNTSRRVKYQKGCASSDGKFFTAKGIPVVNFGPRGANLHRSNEFVKKDSLLLYYNVLDKFIRKIF